MFGKKKLNNEGLTQLQVSILEALRGGEAEVIDLGLTSSEGSEEEEWDEEWDEYEDEGGHLSIDEILAISQRPRLLSQLSEEEQAEFLRAEEFRRRATGIPVVKVK